MRFREHRGSLDDSMATVVTLPATHQALCNHLNSLCLVGVTPVTPDQLIIGEPHFDGRIGWDNRWVTLTGVGVVGSVDSAVSVREETIRPNLNQPADVLQQIAKLRLHARLFENILKGIFLGYSKEGMAAYLTRVIRINTRQKELNFGTSFKGTGYIPCDADIAAGAGVVSDQINARRIYSVPFPRFDISSFGEEYSSWVVRLKTDAEYHYIKETIAYLVAAGLLLDLTAVPDFPTFEVKKPV